MKRIAVAAITIVGTAMATFGSGKLKVVATYDIYGQVAKAVGGEHVEVTALAKGNLDPHFVDAKPSFLVALHRADALLVNGLELEVGFLPPLLQQSGNGKIQPGTDGYVDLSRFIAPIEIPKGGADRSMGDVHPYGNPHYWTDPDNGRVIARGVAAKLAELDPGAAADYARNLAAFESRLTAKEAEWRAKMAPYAGTKVVTFHDSWPNFAKHFGLEVVGHVEPKPGIPPTPSHTLEIVNLIRDQKVPVILVEPYVDTKTPDYIGGQTGARVVVLYPSVGGAPELTDYFALFDHDLDALVAGIRGAK